MSVSILVVDDATFVRDLVKRTIRKLLPNADIIDAQNGIRAQALMRQRPVDLILSDWEMPEMSGEELLRWVRQEQSTAEIPFVMISSRGDRNHVVQAISAGVNDYLTKPFTADELVRKLLKQFQRMGVKVDNSQIPSVRDGDSAHLLTTAGKRAAAAPKDVQLAADFAPRKNDDAAKARSVTFDGTATLRFANGSGECEVAELTLQAMTGFIARDQCSLTLFESAAVDLESNSGETLARLNAYVHSLQATQPHADCDRVKIVVRFVDKDPAKLDALSKFLTKR